MSALQKEVNPQALPSVPKTKRHFDVTLERVTPAQAKELLENTKNYMRQRNVSAAKVAQYTHDMSEGNWHWDTGELIKIGLIETDDGDVVEVAIDGQHRLHGVVGANQSVELLFFRYVPVESFQFIDQGLARSVNNVFHIYGKGWETDVAVVSTISRMLWKKSITGDPSIKPDAKFQTSEGNIAEWAIEHHPDVPALLQTVRPQLAIIERGPTPLGGKAWIFYLYYHWYKLDKKLADDVLDYLANYGAKAPPSPNFLYAAQLALTLRQSFTDPATGKIFRSRNKDLCDFTMQAYQTAWNLTREGKGNMAKGSSVFAAAMKKNNGNRVGEAI